jgi:chaperonin GroES
MFEFPSVPRWVNKKDVVIELDPYEQITESGIITGVGNRSVLDRQTQGTVVVVGSKVKEVEVGDRVIFGKEFGIDYSVGDKKYTQILEKHIQLKIV